MPCTSAIFTASKSVERPGFQPEKTFILAGVFTFFVGSDITESLARSPKITRTSSALSFVAPIPTQSRSSLLKLVIRLPASWYWRAGCPPPTTTKNRSPFFISARNSFRKSRRYGTLIFPGLTSEPPKEMTYCFIMFFSSFLSPCGRGEERDINFSLHPSPGPPHQGEEKLLRANYGWRTGRAFRRARRVFVTIIGNVGQAQVDVGKSRVGFRLDLARQEQV